tara:strand:+ start:154 stop:381 length:228 start_codon:yes stop_codon:yes gene_type:complete
MSTNKNAYEIRADILSQAQGLLHSKYDRDFSIWEQTRTRDPQNGKIIDDVDRPEFPTTEDILIEANKLYSFVDQK